MSGNNNRLPVVPTVTVLAIMKGRLTGASKGHALLKKKADALNMKFRQILKKIVEAKERMGAAMKSSFFSLAQAKYRNGDFRHTVLDNVDTADDGRDSERERGWGQDTEAELRGAGRGKRGRKRSGG